MINSIDEIEDWADEMELFAQHLAFQRRIYKKSLEFYAGSEKHWNRPSARFDRWIRTLFGIGFTSKEEYDQHIDILAQQMGYYPRERIHPLLLQK